MTTQIISTICILLIFAYIFDISSAKTRVPSVILLLLLGFSVQQVTLFFQLQIPDLTQVLPVIGTIGLILIVLEGSLELEINKTKLNFIGKTSIMALLPMLLVSFSLAFLFNYYGNIPFKIGLTNSIPFAIISSAIAIPSVKNLSPINNEFVTYESSLSDIFGVIFFNFITLNDNIGTVSIGYFALEITIILIISFISTIALAFLLSKIKHHVKFVPIILMIILIYSVSKTFHLPALIFILLFGLFIGNIDELKENKLIQKLRPETLKIEVSKFKELTTEIAFLIRSLFFLLFGYLIQTSELLNAKTIIWSLGITLIIFIFRFLFLKLFKLPANPLFFIAPRGLITILLFLSIPLSQTINLVNKSLIIQVIILTAFVMMIGLIVNQKDSTKTF